MAFHFKRKESLEEAVRRLSRNRVECALAALRSDDKLEGIHRVRMEIKKLRAILRLVRKEVGGKFYDRATRALRAAANCLAGLRDAHVTLKAFNELTAHFKKQLPPQPFGEIKRLLRQRCEKAAGRYQGQSLFRSVGRILRTVQRLFDGVRIRDDGWQALCPGVNWSYRRGRCCKMLVLAEASPENFHEWRKRVKDLWYQVRLLRPIWPEEMCAMACELKALSELLGDDHDLVLLKQALVEHRSNVEEAAALGGLIALRQKELRPAALVLGARFYAEKPAVFRN